MWRKLLQSSKMEWFDFKKGGSRSCAKNSLDEKAKRGSFGSFDALIIKRMYFS